MRDRYGTKHSAPYMPLPLAPATPTPARPREPATRKSLFADRAMRPRPSRCQDGRFPSPHMRAGSLRYPHGGPSTLGEMKVLSRQFSFARFRTGRNGARTVVAREGGSRAVGVQHSVLWDPCPFCDGGTAARCGPLACVRACAAWGLLMCNRARWAPQGARRQRAFSRRQTLQSGRRTWRRTVLP